MDSQVPRLAGPPGQNNGSDLQVLHDSHEEQPDLPTLQ
jgi:hypothetical protein